MIKPVSFSRNAYSQNSSENISFKKLKFELDKPTKEYLLRLSAEDNLTADEILETAVSTDLMLHRLTDKANKIAQSYIDNSPLKGKTLDEVWADDTLVKITIKPKRISNEKLILNSYFNDDFYNSENDEKLRNLEGEGRKKIKAIDLWSFIMDLNNEFSDSLIHFVEKSLKKHSKFKKLQDKTVEVDKNEEYAKLKLKKWLDA